MKHKFYIKDFTFNYHRFTTYGNLNLHFGKYIEKFMLLDESIKK